MASSLMRATKKLSTMLYSEFTSIETTIGSAMDVSSGRIGRSFINCSFIGNTPWAVARVVRAKKAARPDPGPGVDRAAKRAPATRR